MLEVLRRNCWHHNNNRINGNKIALLMSAYHACRCHYVLGVQIFPALPRSDSITEAKGYKSPQVT